MLCTNYAEGQEQILSNQKVQNFGTFLLALGQAVTGNTRVTTKAKEVPQVRYK